MGVSRVLVNLGCGSTWHRDWVNFDMHATPPHVRALDVRQPLPFADRSVDAVYHSHVLEHLSRQQALNLMSECLRVLRPNGVLRAVVPDLEAIARLYIQSLEEVIRGGSRFAYDWSLIELYDQTVRQKRGGDMAATIAGAASEHRQFLESRIGSSWASSGQLARAVRLFRASPATFWATARQRLPSLRTTTVDMAVRLTGGARELGHIRLGRFRASGEIHLWMYDRFSLSSLMETAGAEEVITMRPGESHIPGFARFGLEIEDGRARQPISVFVEGFRR